MSRKTERSVLNVSCLYLGSTRHNCSREMETRGQGEKTLPLLLEAQHERAGPQLTDAAIEDTLVSYANSHLPSLTDLIPEGCLTLSALGAEGGIAVADLNSFAQHK